MVSKECAGVCDQARFVGAFFGLQKKSPAQSRA
jgi:hypothetical protein